MITFPDIAKQIKECCISASENDLVLLGRYLMEYRAQYKACGNQFNILEGELNKLEMILYGMAEYNADVNMRQFIEK